MKGGRLRARPSFHSAGGVGEYRIHDGSGRRWSVGRPGKIRDVIGRSASTQATTTATGGSRESWRREDDNAVSTRRRCQQAWSRKERTLPPAVRTFERSIEAEGLAFRSKRHSHAPGSSAAA